ncbi:Uncharacterized protein TCM_040391 [Theobroma cacao]|uniref:Uncharacterized protein n=1 Tax=Theobroma cacao TaxID=3641 RepID=A0A061GTE8_THECC|nr:Uncharacterized protein TCM_040391 [Theobroma cacao]
MDVFHQMVKEKQAAKETTKSKTQKATPARNSSDLVHTTSRSEPTDKMKGKATASAQGVVKPTKKKKKDNGNENWVPQEKNVFQVD